MPGALVALPGTLLPATIFAPVSLEGGWHWRPHDWLASPCNGDLPAAAREIVSQWPQQEHQCRVLVGHSAGGVIALQVAAALGTRLDGLVLIDTGASAANHGDAELPQRLLSQWGAAFIERFMLRCVGQEALVSYGDELRRYALATGPERAYRAMMSLRQLDLTGQLREIRCPTLVVHGVRDPARWLHHAEVLTAGIPNAYMTRLNAGHTSMLECPETLSVPLRDFLDTLA